MNGFAMLVFAGFVIFSKFIVIGCQKLRIPPVIGLIFFGLLCGPSVFNIAHDNETHLMIEHFSEIGVVILLFIVGLETDLDQLKKMGKNSFWIAVGGVFIPFFMGAGVSFLFFKDWPRAVLLGSILTATSVSISVLTFADLKKMNSVEARTIVTSAIIDDIIAIIFLSVILGMIGGGGRSIGMTFVWIISYFVGATVVGMTVVPWLINFVSKYKVPNIVTALAFGFMIIYAWTAHQVELASITGAYACGVFLGRTKQAREIMRDVETIGYTLFVPIFFILTGMNISLKSQPISGMFILFVMVFIFVGIFGKIGGCGAVAKKLGFDWNRSFVIGAGMVPRGEVALVIVSIASSGGRNFLTQADKTSVIFLVLVTAMLTPFMIKWGFSRLSDDKTSSLTKGPSNA